MQKSPFATFISCCNSVARYHHKTREMKTKDRKEKRKKQALGFISIILVHREAEIWRIVVPV
jgi:hypothetical protein